MIEYHPLPTDDPTRRKPNISLAWENLGWRPLVDTEDGLTRTVEFFKSRPGAYRSAAAALCGGQ